MAMSHAVTAPIAHLTSGDGTLLAQAVPVWRDNLAWVIWSPDGKDAAVVDAPEANGVLAQCVALGRPLTTIFNTHTHPDHIGINRDLAKRGLLDAIRVEGAEARRADIPGLTRGLVEGDTVHLGAATGRVWLTEGHLDGHISFVFDDLLFCGDTLFAGGCGYLFDGPPSKMHASLQRLMTLPAHTRVCCAHEYTEDNLAFAAFMEPESPALRARILQVRETRAVGGCTVPSTIGEERATNPFVRVDSPELLATLARLSPAVDADDPVAVFAEVRALKNRKAHLST
jgi:hydroxyacylglutathione hydrolase